jgi:hypothetical protein
VLSTFDSKLGFWRNFLDFPAYLSKDCFRGREAPQGENMELKEFKQQIFV